MFTSTEDTISPPPQTLGWILDLYRSVDDIRADGHTIVYCLSHKVGHLAIFVSTKVGAKQDEEFVQMMDVIDCLPPGLYEMVISPRPSDVPAEGFVTGNWMARFETRSLDDIRVLGRNSPEDDRAFAAVARMSELNLSAYRNWMQPMVRALSSQPAADLALALNPLRLSYTMFADKNHPWMKGIETMAACMAAYRQPVAADNPFLKVQNQVSEQIIAVLDSYRDARDQMFEQMFFGIYGSSFVQALLGIDDDSKVRPSPSTSPRKIAEQHARTKAYAAMLTTGGFNEALTRAVLYVTASEQMIDQRCALALNVARQQLMHMSLAAFKVTVRDQFFVLQLEPERAVEELRHLVPKADAREKLLKQLHTIVGAGGPLMAAERDRMARLSMVLGESAEKPVTPAAVLRASAGAARLRD